MFIVDHLQALPQLVLFKHSVGPCVVPRDELVISQIGHNQCNIQHVSFSIGLWSFSLSYSAYSAVLSGGPI